MDISFDATWCLVCSRQILPKRYQVPIPPSELDEAPEEQQLPAEEPALAPAPPPTTPTAPVVKAPRTRKAAPRAHPVGGFVQGMGRVKRDGTIRVSPTASNTSKKTKQKAAPAQPAPQPQPQVAAAEPARIIRHRTVIDQSPAPLYCSDECRLQDMQTTVGVDINYVPERNAPVVASPSMPPVPHNSFAAASSSSASSDSSVESQPIRGFKWPKQQPTYPIPRAYAALASVYELPPCPPPPPLIRTETSSSTKSTKSEKSPLSGPSRSSPSSDTSDEHRFNRPEDYTSGVMMAARRIQDALGTKPAPKKRPSWATPSSMLSTAYALNVTATAQNKSRTVPGWTDGSDRWRASVYGLAAPSTAGDDIDAQEAEDEQIRRIYSCKGMVSTPLRSRGVYSTLGESSSDAASTSSAASRGRLPLSADGQRAKSEAAELYAKWDMSFTRRSESRSGRKPSSPPQPSCRHHANHRMARYGSPTHSTRSLPLVSSTPRKREVPILKKGAEGKLVVPDVMLKRTDSSASFRAASALADENCSECAQCAVCADEAAQRRGLTRRGSEASVRTESSTTSSRSGGRTTRGNPPMWSYSEGTLLYDILDLPTFEKRFERRKVKEIVRVLGPDGQEHDEEREVEKVVEFEVPVKERKRLFLFPGAGK